jgi:5-methylcytosine-specific restriction endonuclease McrA
MLRKGRKYSPEEILPRVKFPSSLKTAREDLDGDQINFGTLRLQTFAAKGISCIACGLRGLFFVKEKHRTGERYYHLSLYALDANGREVMMTKDHRLSKDKGGTDTLDNLDPMCFPCNQAKGNHSLLEEDEQ